MGKLPTVDEYLETMKDVDAVAADTYRYLNFSEIDSYIKAAQQVLTDTN